MNVGFCFIRTSNEGKGRRNEGKRGDEKSFVFYGNDLRFALIINFACDRFAIEEKLFSSVSFKRDNERR